jgi:dynein assembly factor 1
MPVIMDKKELKKDCVKNGQYSTPALNDKLYLHYKGYHRIENLEEYTGVRALWLEGNGFTKIEGLEALTEVRSLYLQENVIDKIENLEGQATCDSVNFSQNFIMKIENLAHMTQLTSLNMSKNKLPDAASIAHVLEIPSLQNIDLQSNKLEGSDVLDVLEQMPDLRVLYLMGNPCVKDIKNYRRAVVSRCKNLRYLDERPVFDEERRRTDAWAVALNAEGGTMDLANQAERDELEKIRQEKKDADDKNYYAFMDLMKEGQDIRRQNEEAEMIAKGDTGVEEGKKDINPFSGEAIVPVPENPILTKMRDERWNAPHIPPEAEDPQVVELAEDEIVMPPPAPVEVDSSMMPPPPPAAPSVDLCELD